MIISKVILSLFTLLLTYWPPILKTHHEKSNKLSHCYKWRKGNCGSACWKRKKWGKFFTKEKRTPSVKEEKYATVSGRETPGKQAIDFLLARWECGRKKKVVNACMKTFIGQLESPVGFSVGRNIDTLAQCSSPRPHSLVSPIHSTSSPRLRPPTHQPFSFLNMYHKFNH